jgi:hypothetical protein
VYKPVIFIALGFVGSKFAKCVQLCVRNGSMSDGFWSMRIAAISMIVLLANLIMYAGYLSDMRRYEPIYHQQRAVHDDLLRGGA